MTDPAVLLDRNLLLNSSRASGHRPVKTRSQRHPEAFARHVQHIGVGAACWLFEVATDPTGEVNRIPIFLDKNAGRSISLQNDALQLLREVWSFCIRILLARRCWAADVGERKPDRRTEHSLLPLENPVFLVHRPKQFLMGGN